MPSWSFNTVRRRDDKRQGLSARSRTLVGPLDLSGPGLEIGPSHAPILPKSAGFNIRIADYADADRLRDIYGRQGIDVSKIEEVDYVTAGQSLLEAVGTPGAFEYIIASHVIEHMPDLAGFLLDCQSLLSRTGVLALAVPDKRYCFDVLQSISTTGLVLEAHYRGDKAPSPAARFDFAASYATRDGKGAWEPGDTSGFVMTNPVVAAMGDFDRAWNDPGYVDIHVWRFVPSSFRLIVKDLNDLGVIALRELSLVPTGGFEFFVFLSRSGSGCPLDRLSLAKAILSEQAQIVVS